MKTVLDEGQTWFLESLTYENGLVLRLVEGLTSDKPEDVQVGDTVIKDTYRVEITERSKRAVVTFEDTIAWQVVDESYTAWDRNEIRDGEGSLQVLSKSKYLDYVVATHGWFKEVAGPASHYRVWTETEVIDVISTGPPSVAGA